MSRALIKKKSATETPEVSPAYEELRAKVELNRNRLDDNVEEHARLFSEVCDHAVLAESRFDEAVDSLKQTTATLALDIRAGAAKSGEKMTDAICEATTLAHEDYQAALKRMRDAKLEANRWDALRKVYDHRVKMVQKLCDLYASSYFTPQGLGGAARTNRDAGAAEAREKLAQKRAERNKA